MIVGGVAGGASAAAKARRIDENAEIHVFERGPFISFANCGLPYYLAGEIDDLPYLAVCLLRGHGFVNLANLRGGYLQAKLNGLASN